MTFLIGVPIAPPAPYVSTSTALVVVGPSQNRSVDLSKVAGQDPFLASKMLSVMGGPVVAERPVSENEARRVLNPYEQRRFTAIADGYGDIATLQDARGRDLKRLKWASVLGFGALCTSGIGFDLGVIVGTVAAVGATVLKLVIENRGQQRINQRYHNMFRQLEALPPVRLEPEAKPDTEPDTSTAKTDRPRE